MICKHCGQRIVGLTHATGRNRGLMRCNPKDSGVEYGYNAEPVGAPCAPPCLGSKP